VEHAGQLVTKEDLFQAIWPEVVVGDAALTVCIRELRQVLGDNTKAPHYIETIYGRGYRFIGKMVSSQESVISNPSSYPAPSTQPLTPALVGRETELQQLHEWLEKAQGGQRQMVFVTGEPGIGKTTLVDAFLQPLASSPQHPTPRILVGRGQCIEHHGAGEPYLPVLEALGRLCRAPEGAHFIMLLSQYAPTWLAQMPTLLSADELAALQPKVQGATRGRMLRELAEALEATVAWYRDTRWWWEPLKARG
jgi:hypothetical protein